MENKPIQRMKIKKKSLSNFLGRFTLITSMVLFCAFLIIIIFLLISSTGEPISLQDSNGNPISGSVSEKIIIKINGLDQGMFIKSKNASNPVLLFLHGGPGMPEYFLTQTYPTRLEEFFTVVWWDQRGAGLSYNPEIPLETMTIDQIVEDTIEVTNYLRERFGKEKIYLMGHSGGSFIGIKTANRAPELYYAYIGIGQMTYQIKSENLAFNYMLKEYKRQGDKKMVERLVNSPPGMLSPLSDAYLRLRDDAMHRIGIGTTRKMRSVISGIFIPSLLNREYTIIEKLNLWKGKAFSTKYLRDDMFSTDLTKEITSLQIPAYFFHGIFDYTTSYEMAKEYYESIQAPVKGFYTFERSAHSPIFEEPEKMLEILQNDVMNGRNDFKDK